MTRSRLSRTARCRSAPPCRIAGRSHHPAAEVAAAYAKLGVWCEQNGLKPEATEHFTQAVELDPYRDSAWKHLGYVKHNGRWMNREQITAEEKEAIEQTRADRLWEPRLKRWKTWLKDEKLHDQATTEMKSATDPHAVPAVVRIFAQGNERDQIAAVQLLGQIDIPSSTHALPRLAVLSASDAVRSAATAALLRREPRDFAGWLIDYIRIPWQYHVQPVGGPGSPGALQIVAARPDPQPGPSGGSPPLFQKQSPGQGLRRGRATFVPRRTESTPSCRKIDRFVG